MNILRNFCLKIIILSKSINFRRILWIEISIYQEITEKIPEKKILENKKHMREHFCGDFLFLRKLLSSQKKEAGMKSNKYYTLSKYAMNSLISIE